MAALMRWTSLGLFLLLSLFLVAFGILYATVEDMLWFHAAAVPDTAKDAVRPLYFALMNLIGGASAALGLLGVYVTLGPLRQGAPLAAPVLAAAYALAVGAAAVTAEELAAATGSPTSWHLMGIFLALAALALLARLVAGAPRS